MNFSENIYGSDSGGAIHYFYFEIMPDSWIILKPYKQ
jgi:hypothetical protein